MAPKPVSKDLAREAVNFVSGAIADGFVTVGNPSAITEGWRRYSAAHKTKKDRITFRYWVERGAELYGINPSKGRGRKLKAPYRTPAQSVAPDPEAVATSVLFWLRKKHKLGAKSAADLSQRTKFSVRDVASAIDLLRSRGVNIQQIGDRYDIPSRPQQSYVDGSALEIVSRDDNTFVFGAFGDLHAASKHTRWDVRENLVRQSERDGAQAIFDTGNWIDGEAHFNRYDLEVIGLEQQCQMLARRHPKTQLPIYAVAGDDHEGWYAQREGIDVGKYAENIMRTGGHEWTNLGYMEAHVTLCNANSGKTATLAVVHPGGGSAYALSYSIQKIVESYEGGEKPNVGFYGHYHKLWAGIIRNIFVVQTGTQQDQTPFMRKRRLEAHVGGAVVTLEQDPKTGAILGMTPRLIRYFNEAFERGTGRWSHTGPIRQVRRSVKGIAA